MIGFKEIVIDAQKFCKSLIDCLSEKSLLEEFSLIDHICFRTKSMESYEKYKQKITLHSDLISEAYINGRPIATFKLYKPIKVNASYSIDLLELPAPKKGKEIKEGFEHIEVVSNSNLENLLEKFTGLNFVTDNISSSVNREISILFNQGLVKFHESSLEELISLEKLVMNKRRDLVLIEFDEILVTSKRRLVQAANDDMLIIPLGIESMISCLYHEGAEIIVFTDRDKEIVESFLSKSSLENYISKVVSFNSTGASKKSFNDEITLSSKNKNIIVLGNSCSAQESARYIKAKFFQARWLQKLELGEKEENICETPFAFLDKAIYHFRS